MAFSGVALTLMLSAFDISTAGLFVSGLKVWQLVLTIIEIVCSIGSIIMVLIATVRFLILLHGRTVKVFKSEDIIDKDIHKEKSEFAAVWVMDKYTNAVGEMREIIHKKQKSFDKAIVIIIVGIVMYAVSILLQKGGF